MVKIRVLENNILARDSPLALGLYGVLGGRPPVGGWGSPPFGGLHLNNTE